METRDWTDSDFDPSKGPIMVKVPTVEQLFNPIDPQPFNLRDLDVEVADWIGEWADEQRDQDTITIMVVVSDDSAASREDLVAAGIRNHFAYRRWATSRRLSRLWRDGRISLIIGLAALAAFSTASRLVSPSGGNAWLTLLRDGLAVAGWVAMWRPIEVFLYEWWPIRRELRTFQRLAEATVEFRRTPPPLP